MDWRHDYVDGNVRSSCSICGCSRRFPENLTFCDDKLFRCERCMEKTALAFDREIAAARQRREQPDVAIGIKPPWENADSLLTIATERAAALLPGWTPASTLSDTFDTVPGGVGSSWTATGTVAESPDGVTRLTATSNTSSFISATSFTRTTPLFNRWYSIIRFSLDTTPDTKTSLHVGWFGGTLSTFFGVNQAAGGGAATWWSYGQESTGVRTTTTVIDTDVHMAELFCLGDGRLRVALDRGLPLFPGVTISSTINPDIFLFVASGGATQQLSIYDAVYFK